jgi:hypothetical protein
MQKYKNPLFLNGPDPEWFFERGQDPDCTVLKKYLSKTT